MKIGYIRVSTEGQSVARQEELMRQIGAEKIYTDLASGTGAKRPKLEEMLTFVREGDTVVVESISRLARSTKDLLELVAALEAKGVELISQKEAIDTSTPTGRFMLTVFGAVAELERGYMLERQREGIAQAKKAGKYKGRLPIRLDEKHWREVYGRWQAGEITAVRAQKKLGVSASTFYRLARREKPGVF